MNQSIGTAKRLLREMSAEPAALLRSARYHRPAFLKLYFEHLDGLIYDDPQAALPWAEIAPKLALAVVVEEGQNGRREHAEYMAMGYAILGGACRAVGRHDEADDRYREAFELADAAAISPVVRATMQTRLANLRTCQARFDEALGLAEASVGMCRELADGVGLAQALVATGYVFSRSGRYSEAIPCLGEALTVADTKLSAGARTHHSAVHNLAYAVLSTTSDPGTLRAVKEQVQAARSMLRPHRDHVPRFKTYWLEGLIWWRLEHVDPTPTVGDFRVRKALEALNRAHKGFIRLALPYETALVSLDIALIRAYRGEHRKAAAIARETFEHVSVLNDSDREILASLKVWRDAVEAEMVTDEITSKARQLIETRLRPGGCCKKRK